MDWNGDDLNDLIVGECWGRVKFYRAVTADSLTEMDDLMANGSYINGGMTASPLIVDWNADGLLDLLLGCMTPDSGSALRLFLNIGSAGDPKLAAPENILIGGSGVELYACTPRMADLDQDGLADLILGEMKGGVYFARNTGTAEKPSFDKLERLESESGVISKGHNTSPCIDDWNEDGYPDLLLGNDAGLVYLYLSPSTGISEENPGAEGISVDLLSNPCRNSVPVRITLAEPVEVTLNIYSMSGRLVLHDDLGRLEAGVNTVSEETAAFSPGVYVCTCSAGKSSASTCMVVLGGIR